MRAIIRDNGTNQDGTSCAAQTSAAKQNIRLHVVVW